MPPSRRRPQSDARDVAAKGGNKAPLSPSQDNGTPPLVSPRGVGVVVGGAAGGSQHRHNQQHNTQSLDLDVFDDDEAVAMSEAMAGVVKVYASHAEPSFNLPWQRKRQFASTSSGFAVSIPDESSGAPAKRILTNAHSVDYFNQVKCRRRGSDVKHVARVLAIGVECDLALLAVDDAEFWEGIRPVTLSRTLPRLQEKQIVIGYPLGGDSISVTSGVVSRIEVVAYSHGSTELLGVQIDAAINSGNSGGPVFNAAGVCVGVAFQSMAGSGEAEGIGWIIPSAVIVEHFLEDYRRNGRYTGFPCLGVEWQKMESPSLRAALGMSSSNGREASTATTPSPPPARKNKPASAASNGGPSLSPSPSSQQHQHLKGVFVRRVEPTAPVATVVRRGDVLLAIDGVAIGVDGTIPFRAGERIAFSYLISRKFIGDSATLRLLRDGVVVDVETKLAAPYRLVPAHLSGKPPSYFVFGGLVFTALSAPYLRSVYGKDWDYDSPLPLLTQYMLKQAQNRDQQVVVLSQVLASNSVSLGIEDITDCQVHRVNGVPIDSLRSLVRLLDGLEGPEEENKEKKKKKSGGKGKGKAAAASSVAVANGVAAGDKEDGDGKFVRFELDYDQLVVLDVNAAREATPGILEMHSIPNDRSADLLAAEEDDDGDDGGKGKEEAKKGGADGGGGGKKRKAGDPSAASACSKRASAAGKKAVAAGKKKKH